MLEGIKHMKRLLDYGPPFHDVHVALLRQGLRGLRPAAGHIECVRNLCLPARAPRFTHCLCDPGHRWPGKRGD